MTALKYDPIHKLTRADSVDSFDCGNPALNQFLTRYALVNQQAGSAQTYVCCSGGNVAGFYSLTVGSVDPPEAPHRVTKGMPRHPVPVIILARLAVDIPHQGRGLGRAFIKDALLRTLNVSEIVGIRAILVHAKDDAVCTWYQGLGFEPSPTAPFHLFLLLKDLKAIIDSEL